MILLTMKVIHVSGMNGNTIIVVTTMTTILTRTKCAVVVVEDTIPQVNTYNLKIKKHREHTILCNTDLKLA